MVALLLLTMMLGAWWLAVQAYSQPHCERCAARANREHDVELHDECAADDLDALGHDDSGVVERRGLLGCGRVGCVDVVRGPLPPELFQDAADDPVDSLDADLGVVTREEA